jgi:2-dehydropantoate 2-reductase
MAMETTAPTDIHPDRRRQETRMRFIIYGLGAIGGTFAAALQQAGHEVVAIARGAMLEAVARDGLMFRTPRGSARVALEVVASPADIAFRTDDVVVLTMKSQDTADALLDLRAAGLSEQYVVCAQNGVNNERLALRLFPNVVGMTVMMPSDYVVAGEVVCYGAPKYGICDMGLYPRGLDDVVGGIAAALENAGFAAYPTDDVMASKYGKLLENLGNVVEAALGPGERDAQIMAAVRAEAEAARRRAGVTHWLDVGSGNQRRTGVMEMARVEGTERQGGSSTQGLKRGAGSIETDYLNGEIVLLGRLGGAPVPLNTELCRIGQELVGAGAAPGSMSAAALRQRLRLA